MSAMNVANYDRSKIVCERGSLRTSRGDADIDWRHTDTYMSNAVGGYLYFINSDGSSGIRNAVMYIYASTYVLIHSPRWFANRFWLFITSLTLTDRFHLPNLSVSEPINRFFASASHNCIANESGRCRFL